MKRSVIGVVSVAAALLVGLAAAHGQGNPQPLKPPPSGAVLGHLELNAKRITMKAGGRFTVRTRDGKVLAEDITLKQLKAIDPVLQEKLERTIAGGPPGTRWAGL